MMLKPTLKTRVARYVCLGGVTGDELDKADAEEGDQKQKRYQRHQPKSGELEHVASLRRDAAQGGKITVGVEGADAEPDLSPNGKHLAFISSRAGKYQIFTVDRDGNNVRQITRSGENKYPNWSN